MLKKILSPILLMLPAPALACGGSSCGVTWPFLLIPVVSWGVMAAGAMLVISAFLHGFGRRLPGVFSLAQPIATNEEAGFFVKLLLGSIMAMSCVVIVLR